MHPAYRELQEYVDAADDHDAQAAAMAARAEDLLLDAVLMVRATVSRPVEVLCSGVAGTYELPVVVADLDVAGTVLRLRSDGCTQRFWLGATEVSPDELLARLPVRRRLLRRRPSTSPLPRVLPFPRAAR